jgi:hypothetical protein
MLAPGCDFAFNLLDSLLAGNNCLLLLIPGMHCSYFYQITLGCGTVHCTNRNCFSCPDGPRLDPTSAALLAVKLAQSTTHYLCAGAAITIPESLQWTETSSHHVLPLKTLLANASAPSNVQAQACFCAPSCLPFSSFMCLSHGTSEGSHAHAWRGHSCRSNWPPRSGDACRIPRA